MALIKKTRMETARTARAKDDCADAGPDAVAAEAAAPAAKAGPRPEGAVPTAPQRRRARADSRRRQAASGIAAASTELASGVTQAASAAEELRRAMEQIAAGAEESAGATQQSQRMIGRASELLARSRATAEQAVLRVEALQGTLKDVSGQILSSIDGIVRAAEHWLARHPGEAEKTCRFDVIFLAPGRWPRHLINAFES